MNTNLKVLLSIVNDQLVKHLNVLIINHFVSIHPVSLMHPEAGKVQRRFQQIRAGVQETLEG